MKKKDPEESGKIKDSPDQWTISVFEDLEVAQRTQKPPTEELIDRLNHLVKKPPFCWTNKYRDHLPRL
jgi:hypothetical protein